MDRMGKRPSSSKRKPRTSRYSQEIADGHCAVFLRHGRAQLAAEEADLRQT